MQAGEYCDQREKCVYVQVHHAASKAKCKEYAAVVNTKFMV